MTGEILGPDVAIIHLTSPSSPHGKCKDPLGRHNTSNIDMDSYQENNDI
jgi:hypothetical protein